jgi:hypothetical protein
MAEVIFRYVVDPTTHVGSLVVDYRSDADALPEEHEADHQAIVRGLVPEGDAGTVTVERVAEAPVAGQEAPTPVPEPTKLRA